MTKQLSTLYQEHLKTVADRTSSALAASGFDQLVIAAGQTGYHFMDDRSLPFVVNPHFNWWLPVTDNPHCVLHFRPADGPRLLYHIPRDYWHKPAGSPRGIWVESMPTEVFAATSQLDDLLPTQGRVAFIGAENTQKLARQRGWECNPEQLINRLHWLRAAKTDYEIECLRQANACAVAGHCAARQCWQDGGSEYQIHLDYLQATAHTDEELPYHSIVASGRNGAVLHYQHRERERGAEAGNAFLIDAGASVGGYAADITRTQAGNNGLFSELVQGMDKLQQQLVAQVKVGQSYVALHQRAHLAIGELLIESGIATGSAEELSQQGVTGVFFPHGLGHFLGLQVHDVGGHQAAEEGGTLAPPAEHPFLRLTRTLEAGHVVTIEPGLYFIPMLLDPLRAAGGENINWSLVDSLIPCGGVRVEDDVVVAEEGPENLTRDAFSSV